MEKYIFHNKGFTLIELLVYISITSIAMILILGIMYSIIYYTLFYFDRITLKNEMFKILQKIYYNSIISQSVTTTNSSIQFNFGNGYEKIFASGSSLYLENSTASDIFLSPKVKLLNFSVSPSGNYINAFINISNAKGDQSLYATSIIYILGF